MKMSIVILSTKYIMLKKVDELMTLILNFILMVIDQMMSVIHWQGRKLYHVNRVGVSSLIDKSLVLYYFGLVDNIFFIYFTHGANYVFCFYRD